MASRIEPAPDVLAKARALFESGGSVTRVARLLGMSPTTFKRRLVDWRWQANLQSSAPVVASATEKSASEIFDTRRAASELCHVLETEIATLKNTDPKSKQGSEAKARTIASFARALAVLRGIENANADVTRADDETGQPPLDLAELRRELARRLDRLREDGETA